MPHLHTPAYIAAQQRAETTGESKPADRMRHHIGVHGNPVFAEVFSGPATSAGGTHHGRADHASGFCYANDAVLGLLAWLDSGLDSLFYLDIDAHHGDGVEDAFCDDPRDFTCSIHEAGR